MTFNRDTATALVLLLICGVMLANTFQIPAAMIGQMPAALWPRLILIPLAGLSLMLLIRAQVSKDDDSAESRSLSEWFVYYRNPIVCFALFFGFLITMPILGMLIGGLLYVFLTLSFLGGWTGKLVLHHALISAFFVVGMWAIFTQLLGVFLPEGILLKVY